VAKYPVFDQAQLPILLQGSLAIKKHSQSSGLGFLTRLALLPIAVELPPQ
jgi:hypothetical protein